nr:hypothetical protein [uncultured Cohaesibacter sp.]
MRTSKKLQGMLFVCGALLASVSAATAQDIIAALDGRSIYCEGGNESSGRAYYFKADSGVIKRIDPRFPDREVVFDIGSASKGSLGNYWSYETLSDKKGDRLHLYERVSMRSPDQSRHIYTTYEFYKSASGINMVLYNGVNGARDWTQKTVRDCGQKAGNKIMRSGSRYWSTTFAK